MTTTGRIYLLKKLFAFNDYDKSIEPVWFWNGSKLLFSPGSLTLQAKVIGFFFCFASSEIFRNALNEPNVLVIMANIAKCLRKSDFRPASTCRCPSCGTAGDTLLDPAFKKIKNYHESKKCKLKPKITLPPEEGVPVLGRRWRYRKRI